MNKKLVNFILLIVLIFFSCNTLHNTHDKRFISRLHTPKEEIDWYRILGATSLNKHLTDFDAIEWEKEYWEEYKSGDDNNSFLEVMDTENNTYFSVSTFPYQDDSFQFAIYIGSRSLKVEEGKEIEKGYVRCFLLGSNNPEKVKWLMKIFFKRDYDVLFNEIDKLQVLFETEDVYQNIE